MMKRPAIVFALMALSACSAATGPVAPEGETDLTCAALISAAASLHDDKKIEFYPGLSSEVINSQTAFLTRHAETEQLDAQAALGLMKLQRIRMIKDTPSSKIKERALACMGLPS